MNPSPRFPPWLESGAATGLFGLLSGAAGSGAASLPVLALLARQDHGPGLADGVVLLLLAVAFGGLVGALAAVPVAVPAWALGTPEDRPGGSRLAACALVGCLSGVVWSAAISAFGLLSLSITAGFAAVLGQIGPLLLYVAVLTVFGAMMFAWFVPVWVALKSGRPAVVPVEEPLPAGDGYREALAVAKVLRATPVPADRVHLRDQAIRACESVVINIAEGRARRGEATVVHYRHALAAAAEAHALLDLVDLPAANGPQHELKVVQEMLRRRVA